MTQKILKLLYLNPDLGETGLLPNGAIVNIGGVSGSNFTIGGKGVVLADGTTTGPNGTSTQSLQIVYDNSELGDINLTAGKDFRLVGTNNRGITVDALNGNVAITGNTFVTNLNIGGLINGEINLTNFYNTVNTHLAQDVELKHTGDHVSINTNQFEVLSKLDVTKTLQSVIDEIDAKLLTQSATVKTFVFYENAGSTEWFVQHDKTSVNPMIFIYDDAGNQIISDSVAIIDENNIRIQFNVSQRGKAVILLV